MKKVAIIGAGAAGCFCSIELKRRLPDTEVDVLEALHKPLAKVAITGGGRCNLTNSFEGVRMIEEAYPRGGRLMKRLFRRFDHKDTWEWFEKEGVKLVLQEDNCVFPASQDAMEIVDLLLRRMRQEGVVLRTSSRVESITRSGGGYSICVKDKGSYDYDAVVVTTGGGTGEKCIMMLETLDIEHIPEVPSLFTFNISDRGLKELMGTVVEKARVSLAGTKFTAQGPILVTHWGVSGPAVLKLSSYAARHLYDNRNKGKLLVNWMDSTEAEIRAELYRTATEQSKKMAANTHPEAIPARLWTHILSKTGIKPETRWSEVGSKGMNRLVNTILNDEYEITGKSKFRDEFVTCGGVALPELDQNTLESKKNPRLFFAGEATDVDAVTGGFNLQAAWTMGHVVACSIAEAEMKDQSTLPG